MSSGVSRCFILLLPFSKCTGMRVVLAACENKRTTHHVSQYQPHHTPHTPYLTHHTSCTHNPHTGTHHMTPRTTNTPHPTLHTTTYHKPPHTPYHTHTTIRRRGGLSQQPKRHQNQSTRQQKPWTLMPVNWDTQEHRGKGAQDNKGSNSGPRNRDTGRGNKKTKRYENIVAPGHFSAGTMWSLRGGVSEVGKMMKKINTEVARDEKTEALRKIGARSALSLRHVPKMEEEVEFQK